MPALTKNVIFSVYLIIYIDQLKFLVHENINLEEHDLDQEFNLNLERQVLNEKWPTIYSFQPKKKR